MKILGIETSCDETAAAIVEDGINVIASQVASQIELHARYGGIVPEIASRQHILAIAPIIKSVLEEIDNNLNKIDGIAVTIGPGLSGSLLVGVNVAKSIAVAQGIPLIGVNHLEGHIYANWLHNNTSKPKITFPTLCLIVSGGHSDLVLMREHGKYVILGRTRDDASGEAFDKAARILGLGYPGGPAIEQAAKKGFPSMIQLPRAWLKDSYDFSFSGVKTALLRLVEKGKITTQADAAASFQEAIIDVLVTKTVEAAKEYHVKQILLSGGVAANKQLRQRLLDNSPVEVLMPQQKYCTDNAAMIAACGYFLFKEGKANSAELDILPNLKLV